MIPNLNYIEKLADGSVSFKEKMIGILKSEFPQEKEHFLKFYKTQDYTSAAELVHKMKHKIGMLGMKSAYEKLIIFESDLKRADTKCYSEFMTILQIVENYIHKL